MPPAGWPKIYTAEGLQKYFPSAVMAWKANETLPSLIIVVPVDSPKLGPDHFLNCLHSAAALKRYSLGTGKDRKQFAFCSYCGIRSENQVSSYSHVRRHLNYEYLCEACCKKKTRSINKMNRHLESCRSVEAALAALSDSSTGKRTRQQQSKPKPSSAKKRPAPATRGSRR